MRPNAGENQKNPPKTPPPTAESSKRCIKRVRFDQPKPKVDIDKPKRRRRQPVSNGGVRVPYLTHPNTEYGEVLLYCPPKVRRAN